MFAEMWGRGPCAHNYYSLPMDFRLTEYPELRFEFKSDVPPPREIEVEFGKGLKGTIAVPHAVDNDDFLELGYAPETNKMALILHGQGGHRNYCYQKNLAHRLAADLGMYSLRIDFRGCGSSGEVADPEVGRVVELDIEDLQASADFVLDATLNPLKRNFVLLSIICHSRAGVAMYLWAMEQDKLLKDPNTLHRAIVVPNLIGCSVRFRSHTVADSFPFDDDEFEFVDMKAPRHGKMLSVRVTKLELLSLTTPEFSGLRDLSLEWNALSISGTDDRTIPRIDIAYWANALNRGPYSHHAEIIDHADHNFQGTQIIENEGDAEEYNPFNIPLTKKNSVNYNFIVSSFIIKYLSPDQEFERFRAKAHLLTGFYGTKVVDGVSNFRDLGGWPVYNPTFPKLCRPGVRYCVRPGYLFRCANTSELTRQGSDALRELGVKIVYDLRSEQECTKNGVSSNITISGAKRVLAPVFRDEDYSPELIALRMSSLMTSWHTYVQVYDNILENGVELFRTMFLQILQKPDEPFVFHCTAGKDRTGIFAMLVLRLAGVDWYTIAMEYALTTVGLLPDHEKIKAKYIQGLVKVRAKPHAAMMEQAIVLGRKDWTIEEQGFANLVSSYADAMLATLELLDTKYGGILSYMENNLKFSMDEIKLIFTVIVVPSGNSLALYKPSKL